MMSQQEFLSESIKARLISGELEIAGRFMWGSNYTFLVNIHTNEGALTGVYKPSRGERPLWDFPGGTLAAREVAASLTSQELGWDLVPPTVLRMDGPAGPGSLQLYVNADPEHHYFTFNNDEKQRLRPIALFDQVINNADRKGGHIIIAEDSHLWSIDHGVCFHVEDKLRTVIWDFAQEPIPDALLVDLQDFLDRLVAVESIRDDYLELISRSELDALELRVKDILKNPIFPKPTNQWSYPWPLV